MKLLLDQNVPIQAARSLTTAFPGTTHVWDLRLDRAPDQIIRDHAAEHGYIIVTKDDDFLGPAFRFGHPPKIVWLQVGNASAQAIVDLVLDRRDRLQNFADSADEAVLILP